MERGEKGERRDGKVEKELGRGEINSNLHVLAYSKHTYRDWVLTLVHPPSHPHTLTSTHASLTPSQSNHDHLFLQGSDRLYLNSSKSVVSHSNHGNQERGVATDNVSPPQWKVIQLPSNYLVMNWPVKVCVRILQCDWSKYMHYLCLKN